MEKKIKITHYHNIKLPSKVNKKVIQIGQQISKSFDIKLVIEKDSFHGAAGWVFCSKSRVHVFKIKNMRTSVFFSTLFHEITHCLNYRNGKYLAYHKLEGQPLKNLTTRHIKTIIRTAVKAEKYTDKLAELLMFLFFPKMIYIANYSDPEIVFWYKEYFVNFFKEELKNRLQKNRR